MDFFRVVSERRSVRAYRLTPISREKIDRILEAARQAPSAANRQPWRMYVVEEPGLRRKLGKSYSNAWFYEAPVILVICSVPGRSWKRCDGKNYADVDTTIAFEHAILAAHAEGLATCWIGAFIPDVVREALDLPPGEEPLAMTPLGEAEENPAPTARRPHDDLFEYR